MRLDLRLYAVINVTPRYCDLQHILSTLAELIRGGCTIVQYRESDCQDIRATLNRIRAIHALLQRHHVPLIINDRMDLALITQAEGVHLGQKDLPPKEVRRILGKEAIIGMTIHTSEQADALYNEPLNYVSIGAIYPSNQKKHEASQVYLGVEGLRKVLFRVKLSKGNDFPVIAISGIQEHNVSELLSSGLSGVAMVSELFFAQNPYEKAVRIRELIDEQLS